MIKDLKVKDNCISCGLCESICPKNFRVSGKSEVISKDFSNEDDILEAENQCPVSAIVADTGKEKVKKLRKKIILDKKNQLTDDVFEFSFKFKNYDGFSFLPGQFITLFFQDEEGEVYRSYSIVSGSENSFKLCIKLLNGRGSRVLRESKEGDEFFSTSAIGNFVLQNTEREKVFIATGTGIAPIIAMLKSCPKEIKKTVVFGVRYEKDVFYKNVLEKIPNTKVILTISRPSDSWGGFKGRVTDYLDCVKNNGECEVYICGNGDVLNSVLNELNGHSDELIFHEAFNGTVEKNNDVKNNEESTNINTKFDFISGIQYILYILSALTPIVLFFPQYWGLLWDISWYSVTLLMIIRPLSDIFPKLNFLKRLIVLRKGLGILSSSIVVLAGFTNGFKPSIQMNFLSMMDMGRNMGMSMGNHMGMYFNQGYWTLLGYKFFGHLAELVGVVLLITSNTFSQKLLGKNWKLIQKSAYIYFFAGGIYIAQFGKMEAIYSMLIVSILWILAEFKKNN